MAFYLIQKQIPAQTFVQRAITRTHRERGGNIVFVDTANNMSNLNNLGMNCLRTFQYPLQNLKLKAIGFHIACQSL
jgi:hypothetical protein